MPQRVTSPADVIRRPRLEERLDEAFGVRLTLIVASAGFGKSTLLSHWAEDVEAAWFVASASDRQLSTFATGLMDAIGSLVDGAGRPLMPPGGEADAARAEALAALISRWLQQHLDHDVMLIVDDAHELAAAPAALRLVEGICRQAPPPLHLVLATRDVLPIRTERLRAHGALLELTEVDLALTVDEVSSLMPEPLRADDALVAELTQRTSGWPAAVRLALEALRQGDETDWRAAMKQLREPGSPLFTYLAQEVFERETSETIELIRRVALLDRFTLSLCDALGLVDAAGVLRELLRRSLFVIERDGWYALHDLMREFALAVWPLELNDRGRLLTTAGRYFEESGSFEDALRSFAAAPDHEATHRLLVAYGQELLERGAGEILIEAASHLPADLRGVAIELLVGDAHLLRYEPAEAALCYERAHRSTEPMEPRVAWRLARACHMNGDVSTGRAICERASPDGAKLRDRACLHAWWATFAAQLGSIDEARSLATRALAEASDSGDDGALADAHSAACVLSDLEGNRGEEVSHVTAAVVAAERSGDVVRLARARTNLGVNRIFSGDYEIGIAELEKASDLIAGAAPRAKLHAIGNRGHGLRMLGRLDEARADYQTLVDGSGDDALHSAIGRIGLAEVWRERGIAELARANYARGLAIAEKTGFRVVQLTALAGLARSLVDVDPLEAERRGRQAVELGVTELTSPRTALGWVMLALGDCDEAARLSGEAREVAHTGRVPHEVAESLELVACASADMTVRNALLADALALRRELGNPVRVALCELALAQTLGGAEGQRAAAAATRRLNSHGVRLSITAPAGLLRQVAPTAPASLVVQTLGGFSVLRDGKALVDADWQSRKARDLLKILVSRRGRATPREQLMDALWPGEDPTRLANRLSVTLSTLRAVLDPEKRLSPDAFVRGGRDSVALAPGAVIDLEVFFREAEEGLAVRGAGELAEARDRLQHAESLYAGEFLDEDPYADWAVATREEARATYITVSRALAEDALTAGDTDRATRSFLRILGRDAYDEHAHLGLVAAFEQSGRHGEARRAYGLYVERMEEIGITPAAFPASL